MGERLNNVNYLEEYKVTPPVANADRLFQDASIQESDVGKSA